MLFCLPRTRLACSFIPWLAASTACVAARTEETAAPAVPTVVSIPVAPAGATHTALVSAPVPAPERAPEPAPVLLPAPAPVQETAAADAPAPATPEAFPPARVVLADESPYRWSHARAKSASPVAMDHSRAHTRKRIRAGRPYHPAPGIVIDVTDGGGGAGVADLQRTARSEGYWPVRRCYEEGLRRDQALSGKVSLDLAVAAGGVERAAVVSTTLRDESVALCVGREASHLPLSSGPSPILAKVEVTLSTGDEPVFMPRPALHAEEVREALRASWPAVERCYASELAKHPDLGGRLELRFRARHSGEIVEVAEEGEPRFASVDVTRCVLGVYRSTRLPAARVCTSGEASFAYAMHLEARTLERSERAADKPEARTLERSETAAYKPEAAQNTSPAAK